MFGAAHFRYVSLVWYFFTLCIYIRYIYIYCVFWVFLFFSFFLLVRMEVNVSHHELSQKKLLPSAYTHKSLQADKGRYV